MTETSTYAVAGNLGFAVFGIDGPDSVFRFALARYLDGYTASKDRPLVVIGLNPSTADHNNDDPTIRREKAFAQREGCTLLYKLNLWPWRSTDPLGLLWGIGQCTASVLFRNDDLIRDAAAWAVRTSGRVVCAWGTSSNRMLRHQIETRAEAMLLSLRGIPTSSFGRTKSGAPRHPLYLSAETPLQAYP